MKTIVVAGDLMWNHYLVQHESAPKAHHEATVSTVVENCAGGAWYSKDLVELACSNPGHDSVSILCAPRHGNKRPDAGLAVSDAYQVCARFPHIAGDKQPTTWRIKDFLGCRLPEPADRPLVVEHDVPNPDVLLIDDVNLGFNKEDKYDGPWPLALKAGGNPTRIVYKTSASPNSALWKKLLKDFADRMTVVVPADALRTKCAAISKALSWDQTIEDVVREFEHGACTSELAKCRRVIVHFGPAGAACLSRVPLHGVDAEADPRAGNMRLERFVYRPDELEGVWYEKHPGLTFGVSPIIAAAVVRHELESSTYPLFIAVSRALGAARESHGIGGGRGARFVPDASIKAIGELYHPSPSKKDELHDPAGVYFSSFPHELLTCAPLKDQPASKSNLLRDLTGASDEYVAAKAIEVVMWGPDKALDATPKARYGNYLTVDRDEIERINAVRNLILTYREQKDDRKPLSIAVFGPPGSGKSFAIRELAAEVLIGFRKPLEFNLSQFNTIADLHHAFHEVADATVRGEMPLVFWDEFDATLNNERFFWLRHFLEPMQDGSFRSDGASHPLGKAIFVFAGGTCYTQQDFAGLDRDATKWTDFKARKGPDFVSRLRGHVNIKGPNREEAAQCGVESEETTRAPGRDSEFFIRRALLLRALLQRHHKHLLKKQPAQISPGVINAFLRIPKYVHGARSLEAVVSMSSVGTDLFYSPAHMPPEHLLKMHVEGDFVSLVTTGELGPETLEKLAEACHEAWRAYKVRNGWTHALVRNDQLKHHHLLVPYTELDESDKERNRASARTTRAKLLGIGIDVMPVAILEERPTKEEPLTESDIESLKGTEHDRWMREMLLQGYEWSADSFPALKLHRDIAPLEELRREDQLIDDEITRFIPDELWKLGYVLVRTPAAGGQT